MVVKMQKLETQESPTDACKRRKMPWRTPRVIESEIERDTNGGSAALPEANGGFLSS